MGLIPAWLVLELIGEPARESFEAVEFRDDLVNLMNRPSDATGPATGMTFAELRNRAELTMFEVDGAAIQPFERHLSWYWGRPMFKLDMLGRRFGLWGYFNLLLVAVGAFVVGTLDVNKWYEGRYLSLFSRWELWLLGSVNVLLVVGLYVVLAESGVVSYDDTGWALGVAVAPTMLLRTTFFQSPTGKAIGLAGIYDNLLDLLTRHLMTAKHRTRTPIVNTLAFSNSEPKMEAKLHSIYQGHAGLKDQLERDLKEELDKTEELVGVERVLSRRRVYARRLLRWLKWRTLREDFAWDELQVDHPVDPEKVVAEAVNYCRSSDERRKHVQELIEARRANRQDDESKRMSDELKAELGKAAGGDLFIRIRYLMLVCGMTPAALAQEGLFPKSSKLWKRMAQPFAAPESTGGEASI